MQATESTFEEIGPIWASNLWAGRKSRIESHSAMRWLGGIDMNLMKSQASFWTIREAAHGIAVLSGHFGGWIEDPEMYSATDSTSPSTPPGQFSDSRLWGENRNTLIRSYRTRGLWVHPNFRNQGAARILMASASEQASKENCKVIWTFPRQSSMPVYEKIGFKMLGSWIGKNTPGSGEFGPNCYAFLKLQN